MVLEHWDDADHGAEALSQEAFTRGSFDNITGDSTPPHPNQFLFFLAFFLQAYLQMLHVHV
jgi:hypothetical protein